jgi:four helix bundle protein
VSDFSKLVGAVVDGVAMRGIRKLEVGDVTLQAIGALRPLVDGIRRRDRALSEQLVRAMTNVALCISRAEFPVEGTRRGHLFAALASASEAQAVLHVAIDWEYCTEQRAKPARALLDKTQALLCQLARRK